MCCCLYGYFIHAVTAAPNTIGYEGVFNNFIFEMRKLRLREDQAACPSMSASEWWTQEQNGTVWLQNRCLPTPPRPWSRTAGASQLRAPDAALPVPGPPPRLPWFPPHCAPRSVS